MDHFNPLAVLNLAVDHFGHIVGPFWMQL